MYLNGNGLAHFPDVSLKDGLTDLGVARCNLKSLPDDLSDFTRLGYLDARDNNITYVDNSLKQLISNSGIESYFSGNGVCDVDKSLDCSPLCSKSCWSRKASGNGICDDTCWSKECNFDGGECGVIR